MPIGGVYDTGTVAVVNGSATVVGLGVFWSDVMEGDHLIIGGLLSLILSCDTDTNTIVLMKPYGGASNSSAAYQIAKMSWLRYDPSTVMYQVRDFLSRISDSNTGLFYYTTGEPESGIGENGDLAIDVTGDLWIFWQKVAGVWVLQTGVVGASEVLQADRTIWVRLDGDDSHTGDTNTAGGALLTLKAAIEKARNIYPNGYRVTIRLGLGSFDTVEATYCNLVLFTSDYLYIEGNDSVGGTVLYQSGDWTALAVTDGGITVRNFKVISDSADGISVYQGGMVTVLDGMIFGSCYGRLVAYDTGMIAIGASFTVAGPGTEGYALGAFDGAEIKGRPGVTVSVTGTPDFSAGFAYAALGSLIDCNGLTFTGAATGVRSAGDNNSRIIPGTNAFPGTIDTNLPLGFSYTAVQQGTGPGQTTHPVQIGWSTDNLLKAAIGGTAIGHLLTDAPIVAQSLPNINLTGVPVAPTAAPGTNTTQVATTAFANAAAIAQSGTVKLASGSFSAVTLLDVLLTSIPGYEEYEIHFKGMSFSIDSSVVLIRTSSNGGSSYDAGSSDYSHHTQWARLTEVNKYGTALDTKIDTAFCGAAANDIYHAVYKLRKPSAARFCLIEYQGVSFETSQTFTFHGAGARLSAADVDAVRFLMSTGTMTGAYAVYGVR